jgi:hypothetical protein
MIQVDLPFTFGTASLMAAAVERGLRSPKARYFHARALSLNLAFQGIFVIWLPVFFLVNEFGLQTSHMWFHGDSLSEYRWLLPVFISLYFATNVAGFQVGAWLSASGRAGTAKAIFWAGTVFTFAWMAVQPYRTLSLGTYAEWQAGTAPWLWTDPVLTTAVVVEFVGVFAGIYVMYRWLTREAATALVGDGTTRDAVRTSVSSVQ